MTLPRQTRKHIERGDWDALEENWLTHLADDPGDLDYFVSTGRAVAASGEEERARLLLELVDDQLAGNGDWDDRLRLLERLGALHPAGDDYHDQILATLDRCHSGQPSLEGLIELVGLHRAKDDVPKTWEKVARLRTLMQFEVGTVVRMEGKGVGRVVEVNLDLQSFKLDFEHHGEIRVGFKAAGKMLQPLPEEHFLRRKLEAPEELRQIKESDPGALLRLLLESYGEAMSAAQIRAAVAGVVEESEWSSWWSAARRHPQVVAEGAGSRRGYRWAGSGEEAGEALLEQFRAADLAGKLSLYRKESDRHPELAERMGAALVELGRRAAAGEPESAYAVASALERGGPAAPEPEWEPAELVRSAADPAAWVPRLADKALRLTALGQIRELRDDWPRIFAALLRHEEEPALLDRIADELRRAEPGAVGGFIDEVLGQPRRRPAAFVWLLERIAGDDLLEGRNPLRLLQLATSEGGREEFRAVRPRLKQLNESGAVLAALIGRLRPEQGPAAEETLRRARLADHLRERLITALHLRFPELRAEPAATRLYATMPSIDARRARLRELLEVEIPANRKAIEEARALGDLSENFEYKSARQRHEYLTARAADLDADLSRVQPIDFSAVGTGEIRIGSRVTFRDREDGEHTLTILGPWESDPDSGIVSYQSDLAGSLLGKKPGDEVEVFGQRMKVSAIDPASEAAEG